MAGREAFVGRALASEMGSPFDIVPFSLSHSVCLLLYISLYNVSHPSSFHRSAAEGPLCPSGHGRICFRPPIRTGDLSEKNKD
ncbi:hypothetical protein VTH06DRAFT_3561 [Thermothelomyces fergusii]